MPRTMRHTQEVVNWVEGHLAEGTNVGVHCLGCHHRAPNMIRALLICLEGPRYRDVA
jgi:hypothetical protein